MELVSATSYFKLADVSDDATLATQSLMVELVSTIRISLLGGKMTHSGTFSRDFDQTYCACDKCPLALSK